MDHITSLNIQGRLITSIVQILSKASIAHWAREIEKLPASIFIFVRKALQQQLPTASNLVKWGKLQDDSCPLCGQKQSNLHVLSNCSSPAALSRYKDRHDTILELLVNWIESILAPEKKLCRSWKAEVSTSCNSVSVISSRHRHIRPAKHCHTRTDRLPRRKHSEI